MLFPLVSTYAYLSNLSFTPTVPSGSIPDCHRRQLSRTGGLRPGHSTGSNDTTRISHPGYSRNCANPAERRSAAAGCARDTRLDAAVANRYAGVVATGVGNRHGDGGISGDVVTVRCVDGDDGLFRDERSFEQKEAEERRFAEACDEYHAVVALPAYSGEYE